MKNFYLLSLLLIILDHTRASLITRFNTLEAVCDPIVKEPPELELASANVKKLTIAFSYGTTLSTCDTGGTLPSGPNFLELTVSKDSVDTKILEFGIDPDIITMKSWWTTDASGEKTLIASSTTNLIKLAVSFDFEKGTVSTAFLSNEISDYYNHLLISGLNYNGLAFDETMKLTFPSLSTFSDVIIEYNTYYPEKSLFPFLIAPLPPALISSYKFKGGSGYSAADSQETENPSADNFGTMYLGSNTDGTSTEDEDSNPDWTKDGLEFTKSTQYTNIDLDSSFAGKQADSDTNSMTSLQSIGFSFWVKLKEDPTETKLLIREYYNPGGGGSGQDLIRISIDVGRNLVVSYKGNNVARSLASLVLNQWTHVTVNFAIGDSFVAGTIYFDNVLQTESNFIIENPDFRLLGAEDIGDKFQLGKGFIGELQNLKIFAPGVAQLTFPSKITGCLVDSGLETPVCITEQCPSKESTTLCPPDSGEEEEEEEEDEGKNTGTTVRKTSKNESDALSNGGLAGVVIGTMITGVILGVVIHLIARKRQKMLKKSGKDYQVPETPTVTSLKKTTEV